MATVEQWAEHIAGEYCGWCKEPDEWDWTDIIGIVRLECTMDADGQLSVDLQNMEIGTWTGRFRVDGRVLEGTIGSDERQARFELKYAAVRQVDDSIRVGFLGQLHVLRDGSVSDLRFDGYEAPRPLAGE